jgi:hypothetical protein
LLGYWFVVWVAAMVRYRPTGRTPIGLRFLWWMSAPTFCLFAAASLRTKVQINWPVAAYLSGGGLAAGWLAERLSRPRATWSRRCFIAAVGVGLVLTILAHDTRWIAALTGRFVPTESPENPTPGRRFDFAARLKGWRYLGGELDTLRGEVRAAEGTDPVLAGLRWDVPGLLSFYTDGHPQAYSLGLLLRYDRHSQYDLWHPNPADDAQAFRGRTFLVVGPADPSGAVAPAFETVGPVREVTYRENGRAIAVWYVCVCRGYRGIDPDLRIQGPAGH